MRWWRRKEREEDLERELRDHLDLEAREQRDEGLSPEEAQFAARRLFGNTTLVAEQVRETWGWICLERLGQDLRYGLRGLSRSPVFTVVSVLSLGLGIGATLTIFSVFQAVLFDAVTAKEVERLKHVDIGGQRFSYRFYEELSTDNPLLAGVAAFDQSSMSFRSNSELEKITGDVVSGNFFEVIGIAPLLGRTFSPDEGRPERQSRAVVLSYGFWKRKFASDPGVLGNAMELDGEMYTIIGVLPKGYRSVHGYGITPEVFVPINGHRVDLGSPGIARFQLIARLQDGVTASQTQSSLVPIVQQWRQRYPTETSTDRVQVYSLSGLEKMRQDGVPVELTLFFGFLIVAAGLVLLIACANVAGLLLARGANRSREIGVRLALGAARHRLVQQLLTESFLLAALGAAAGMAIFTLAATLFDQVQLRPSFPLELHLSLDARLIAFSITLVFLATLLSGLAPAWQTSTSNRHVGSRQIGEESRPRRSARRMLVMGQFALAFVLLVSAALFLRSLASMSRVDPGFDVDHLLTAEVHLDRNSYTQQRTEQYFQAAIADISRLPGVRSVSGAAVVPLAVEHWVMSMKAGEQIIQRVHVNSVTPGYFRTMRIPLRQGRAFEESDRAGGIAVAIVNETFARKYLNDHAVDAQVFVPEPGSPPSSSSVRVVGVVADSKYGSLGEDPTPALYWPYSQQYRPLVIQVSTDGPASGDLSAIRDALTRLDPCAPIKLKSMQEQLAGALLPSRIASVLLGSMGSLGLLLAVIGIYGVMAYSVSRRTPEIGLRLALGATRMQVLRMILQEAGRLVAAGMTAGLVMALLLTQPLAALLASGMNVIDPISFASVGALLSIIALTAALIPAWGASRVDPLVALRSE